MKTGTKIRTNATRYVILGLLTDSPLTGYDIKKLVDVRFRYFWNESFGQIYPELKKLAEEDLVELLPDPVNPGGRPKKRYRITDKGQTAFSEWMGQAPDHETQRNEFLLKLFWAPFAPPFRINDYIQSFRVRHSEDLHQLKEMESELSSIIDMHPNHWWILQTIRLGLRINETYIAWADELLDGMEGKCNGQ